MKKILVLCTGNSCRSQMAEGYLRFFGNNKFEIYNLADDEPCASYEVNNYAAKLLNIIAPEIIDIKYAKISELMKEFYADNKRVCNKKIKNKLDLKLHFANVCVN